MAVNAQVVGPDVLATMLQHALNQRVAMVISGPPGIGKSQVVAQVARKMFGNQQGQHLVDFRAATRDPVDLHGVPAVAEYNNDRRTVWTVPEFFPTEGDIKAGTYAERGVIFLDEIGLAPPSMQGALFGFVLDREVGKYRLPDGWGVVAATNRQEDRSGAYRMLAALADRFTSVELTVNGDAWLRWAINRQLDPRVVGFIRNNEKALHDFDPDQSAFPTPRGWERVADRWLNAIGDKSAVKVAAEEGWLRPAIAGTVGSGAASEFFAFLQTYEELPNINDVWTKPDEARVPNKGSAKYMIATTLAIRVKPEQMTAFAIYLLRMPKEIGAMAMLDLEAREDKDDLQATHGFSKMAQAFTSITIGA